MRGPWWHVMGHWWSDCGIDRGDRSCWWGWLVVVSLQSYRMNRHFSLDVDEIDSVVGHPVLEHAEVHMVDGYFEGRRLAQDQDIEYLARMQWHATEALLRTPHLVRHVVAHNAMLAASHTQVQRNVIAGLSDAASLEVYHEPRTEKYIYSEGKIVTHGESQRLVCEGEIHSKL